MKKVTLFLVILLIATISCAPIASSSSYDYEGYLINLEVLETSPIDNWAKVNILLETGTNKIKLVSIYVRLNELPEVVKGQMVYLKNMGQFALTGRNLYSITEAKP